MTPLWHLLQPVDAEVRSGGGDKVVLQARAASHEAAAHAVLHCRRRVDLLVQRVHDVLLLPYGGQDETMSKERANAPLLTIRMASRRLTV